MFKTIKKVCVVFVATLFIAYTYGQKHDYYTILKSLPAVPNNVLASEKEKETYRDKLDQIRTVIADYQTEFENIVERKISVEEYNSIETVLKEYESIYDRKISSVLVKMMDKWAKLIEKKQELTAVLNQANESLYQQLSVLISKPKSAKNDELIKNSRRKIYDSKMLLYPQLQTEMSSFLEASFDELASVAQYVEKLDNMTLHIIKLPNADVGPTLLQNYIKLLYDFDGAFYYRLGSFEEYFKDEWSVDYLLIDSPI